MSSAPPPPPTAMAATLVPFLPSEKRICDPRHHEMATAILTLADGLEAHIPGSRKRIADLEAILWAPITGAFAGRYARWSDSQRTKNMRNRLYSLMLHYAQLYEVTQYPSPTETLARRMQDAVDAATAGDQLRREVEQGRLVHRANMNAQYEGALGTRPSSYGNSGLYPSDPVLAGAYDLLPSQPRSQNNVLNPVVQPQPPSAVDHLSPHGEAAAPNDAGVIIVVPPPQDTAAVTPPPGGGGVVLATPPAIPNGGGGAAGGAPPAGAPADGFAIAAALADPLSDTMTPRVGTVAYQRAQAARRVTQRQMAAAAVGGGNRTTPTILATADAGQIRRGRGPDLEGTVGTLNGLLERTHSMINSSLNAGARSSAESPESKTIRKFGTVASRLEGLYKVCGMQVDQGVSTAKKCHYPPSSGMI